MAVPVFDYASITPQGSPFAKNLGQNISEGIELGYLPKEKQQSLQKAIADNAILKAQVPYANQMAGYARDIARTNAQVAPAAAILNSVNPITGAYYALHPELLSKIAAQFQGLMGNVGQPYDPRPDQSNVGAQAQPQSPTTAESPQMSLVERLISGGRAFAGYPNKQYVNPNANMDNSSNQKVNTYDTGMTPLQMAMNPKAAAPKHPLRSIIEQNGVPSEQDFEATARANHMTVAEVKKYLGYS